MNQITIDWLVTFQEKMHGNKDGSWDKKISPKIKMNAKDVIKMYEGHIKQVKALANEYKFKAFFFWQPNLFLSNQGNAPP